MTADFDGFAGNGNDSFDVIVFLVLRGGEDNDVACLGPVKAVRDFIGKEVVAVVKIGVHGVAFDLVGGKEKKIDNNKDRQGNDNGFDCFKEEVGGFLQEAKHG